MVHREQREGDGLRQQNVTMHLDRLYAKLHLHSIHTLHTLSIRRFLEQQCGRRRDSYSKKSPHGQTSKTGYPFMPASVDFYFIIYVCLKRTSIFQISSASDAITAPPMASVPPGAAMDGADARGAGPGSALLAGGIMAGTALKEGLATLAGPAREYAFVTQSPPMEGVLHGRIQALTMRCWGTFAEKGDFSH